MQPGLLSFRADSILMPTLDQAPARRLAWFLGSLAILAPALCNLFPFLYADSGTYLYVGFTGNPSEIRPVLYGWFLRHISMKDSLWLPVMVQAGLVSWIVLRIVRAVVPAFPAMWAVAGLAVLSLGTSLGLTTGMLMPDFLTPVMILLSWLMLRGQLRRWEFPVLTILLWFALGSHHSHPFILFLMLAGWIALLLLPWWRRQMQMNWGRWIWVLAVCVAGYVSIPALNAVQGGGWVRSHSGNIFLVNRMNEMGLLKPFLASACAQEDYSLCAYQHQLPRSFMWDPESPVNKDGGWIGNNERYASVVKDFFSRPVFVKKFAIKSAESILQQLFSFDLCIIVTEREGGFPYRILEQNLPEFLASYQQSRQYRGLWSNDVVDFLQRLIVLASVLWILWVSWGAGSTPPNREQWMPLLILVLLGLLANAAVCAGISTVDPRFQARVIWLLPLLAGLAAGRGVGEV